MAASLLAIMAVHELGHFMVARWFKVPALWPVFVPWLGACVVMLSKAKSAHDQAWIALGGPVCGIALTCLFHWLAFCVDSELLLDAAIWGYLVHLINLIPAGGLDGGHVAGFIGRWLWVPGAAGLILATFLIGDLSWYSRLLLGFLAFTAVCRAWAFVAEKTTAREPFVEEPISSSRKKVVWLVFLSLAYVCAGGAILAQLQLEAQMIHRLEHGGRGLDKPDAEDARTEESSDREYDIMNGTERFF
jgi:Zn-dependent protease